MKILSRQGGFALPEAIIILGITTFIFLAMGEWIHTFQKSSKQMKEWSDFKTLAGFLQTQFQQMDPLTCQGYFAGTPIITSVTGGPPTYLNLQKEAYNPPSSAPSLPFRISNSTSNPSTVDGNTTKLALYTVDNICNSDVTKTCAGVLYLEIYRNSGPTTSFFGLRSATGTATFQYYLGDITFNVSGSNGPITGCNYVVAAPGQVFDYSTCDYVAPLYAPQGSAVAGSGSLAKCPPTYSSLGVCAGGSCPGGGYASTLCCRQKIPSRMLDPLGGVVKPVPTVRPSCNAPAPNLGSKKQVVEVVTGICSPGCGVECTPQSGLTVVTAFCHSVTVSAGPNFTNCPYGELLYSYDSIANAITCCPIVY
jgi:hypothetical protein